MFLVKTPLVDQSLVVLNNLSGIPIETVTEIVESLKGTSCEHHIDIYQTVINFWKEHDRYPDLSYLKSKFGNLIAERAEPNFTLDYVAGLTSGLRQESLQLSIREATLLGDYDEVDRLLQRRRALVEEIKPYTEDNALADYKKMLERPSGIELGIPEIDEVVNGICYGNPCIIGGPPGSGKSTLAISATYNAVTKGKFNAAFISVELMKRDVMYNFWSRHSYEMFGSGEDGALKAERIKKGLLSEEEYARLEEVVEDWKTMERGQLRIFSAEDFTAFSPAAMTHVFNQLDDEWEGKLDMVVLDYVQMCRSWRPDRADAMEFMNDLVRYFTNLCVSFRGRGLVVILLSQINREGAKRMAKSKVADLSSFAEVNSLERDAHTAIALYADAATKLSGNMMVQVVKNRSGQVMEELRTVSFEPEYFVVGGLRSSSVISESALDTVIGVSGGDTDIQGW